MRTSAPRRVPLQPTVRVQPQPPLSVRLVGLCVWCCDIIAWIVRSIESAVWTRPETTRPSCSLIPVAAGSPPHWDPIDSAHGNTTLVLLSKDNPKHAAELTQVQQNWTRTRGVGTIVAVHRVQNLTLWSAYERKKAELQQSGSLAQSDVVVYHGTRSNAPDLVHAGSVGFDPSKGGGECWFSESANFSTLFFSLVGSSPLATGGARRPYKQIFQALITITKGDYTGQAGAFSVDHAARAYPQYLITFT